MLATIRLPKSIIVSTMSRESDHNNLTGHDNAISSIVNEREEAKQVDAPGSRRLSNNPNEFQRSLQPDFLFRQQQLQHAMDLQRLTSGSGAATGVGGLAGASADVSSSILGLGGTATPGAAAAARRLALQQALLGEQDALPSSRSSLLSGLGGGRGVGAAADSLTAYHHQIQAERLLLQQQEQQLQLLGLLGQPGRTNLGLMNGAGGAAAGGGAATSALGLGGGENFPNHSLLSGSGTSSRLQERIALGGAGGGGGGLARSSINDLDPLRILASQGYSSAADLKEQGGDGAPDSRRSSNALALEKVGASDMPGTAAAAEESSDEEDVSDREEDALDDEAYFKKRDQIETVEDLHLQNETFPMKLYRMLYEVERDGLTHVVSFLPHGRAFNIHKQSEFAAILPKYFSTDRMASFQRQLNLYGFRRITEGKDKGAFYHEKFLQGKRTMAKRIKRKRSNRGKPSSRHGISPRRSSSASSLLSGADWDRSIAAGQGSISLGVNIGSTMRGGLLGSIGTGRAGSVSSLAAADPSGISLTSAGLGGFASAPSPRLQQHMQQQQMQQLQQMREQELARQILLEQQRKRQNDSRQGDP